MLWWSNYISILITCTKSRPCRWVYTWAVRCIKPHYTCISQWQCNTVGSTTSTMHKLMAWPFHCYRRLLNHSALIGHNRQIKELSVWCSLDLRCHLVLKSMRIFMFTPGHLSNGTPINMDAIPTYKTTRTSNYPNKHPTKWYLSTADYCSYWHLYNLHCDVEQRPVGFGWTYLGYGSQSIELNVGMDAKCWKERRTFGISSR